MYGISRRIGEEKKAERLWKIPRVCSVRYRCCRCRYGCGTEVTEVSGTGIDVVPKLPKCQVPVWITELTEVSGTGIDVVLNLPKSPVPVWLSYRTYRSVRYG